MLIGCRAEPPAGVFRCTDSSDCPTAFECRPDLDGELFCFHALGDLRGRAPAERESPVESPEAGCEEPGGCARNDGDPVDAGGAEPRGAGMGGSLGQGGMNAAGAAAPARGGAGAPAAKAGGGGAPPVSCSAGFRGCPNGLCYSTGDHPDHCGPECTVCKHDTICKAGRCVPCVTSSERTCANMNQCFAKTDPMHCGSSCIVCPSSPYATSTCENDSCKLVCKSDALSCTGQAAACIRASWDFEDNTTQGWTLGDSSSADASIMSTRTHAGRHAFAANVRVNSPETGAEVMLMTDLCSFNAAPDLAGKTISAWFYFDGPALAENCCEIAPYVLVPSSGGQTSFSPNVKAMKPLDQARIGQWFKVSGTMPSNSPQTVRRVYLKASLRVDSWVGTMYVDDIRIE